MSEPDRATTLETMAALLENDLRHGEDYNSFPVRMHPDQCREWIHRLREIRDYIAALEREKVALLTDRERLQEIVNELARQRPAELRQRAESSEVEVTNGN